MKSKSTIILILVVLAAMFFGYAALFGEDETVAPEEMAAGAGNAGDDLIALLEQLKSLRMDGEVFSLAAFRSLDDMTMDVVDEPIGRDNPFATLGIGGGPSASAATTTGARR